MKFNLKWLSAAFAVGVLALAAAPWTVSQSAQIDAIAKQIGLRSGLRLTSHGRSVFAVLPRPHIRIYEPDFDRPDGALALSASSLRVDLSLASLLTGRVEMGRSVFSDAVLTLDAARLAAPTPPLPAGEARGKEARGIWAPPGDVRIVRGGIMLKRAGDKRELLADAIDAHLEWDRADAPLSLAGQCRLPSLGEDQAPARFALWVAQPEKLLTGGASPITLGIDDESFRVNLNGSGNLQPRLRFQGKFASSAPSLRAAAGWLGVVLPLPGPYRDASIKGDASIDAAMLSFPSLSLSIDGNELDGAASIRLDGARPSISATLAGASVNLGPLLEDMPTPVIGGQWSHETFAPSHLSAVDLDLRLSASHARAGDFQFDDAALSVMLKNGRLDLSLAEASAYSGEIRARTAIADSGAGLDVRGSISAEKIDSAALLWDGLKRQMLTGEASGAVTFETNGDNFYEMANRLDARGDFSVVTGEVFGLDLGLAFRRMLSHPLTAGVDLRSGRTSFDQLAGKFTIVQGQADIEEGVARDPRLQVFFSGRAQVAERRLDLHAAAVRVEASGEQAATQLGFAVTGGWDDPVVAPDAEGLIRRSNAAAPLLPKAAPKD